MQVGFMIQKALCELFILKSTKPLPMIFKAYKEVTMTSFNIDEVLSSHRSCHCQCAMTTLSVTTVRQCFPLSDCCDTTVADIG